jgi:hypothetical protein
MRDLAFLFVHLLVVICRLATPGGIRSVIAESVLVKHQLLILNRSRKRAPNLRALDRIITGLCALLMRPPRVIRCAIVLRPSTVFHLHRVLRGPTNVLGAGGHGSVHTPHYRIRSSSGKRGWSGALPHVQSSDSRPGCSEILEFRSRSVIPISSMASQPKSARRHGNQDCSLCSPVASIRGAIDWDDSSRMSGPATILDGGGSGSKTGGFRKVLQQIPGSCVAGRSHSDRNVGIQRRQFQVLSLAETLSWFIPNTNSCMSTNSPRTGCRPLPFDCLPALQPHW